MQNPRWAYCPILRVREIMEPVFETIPVATAYEEVLEKCLGNRANCMYVVDEKENLVGVVSSSNLKQLPLEGKNGKHLSTADQCIKGMETNSR